MRNQVEKRQAEAFFFPFGAKASEERLLSMASWEFTIVGRLIEKCEGYIHAPDRKSDHGGTPDRLILIGWRNGPC